MNKGIFGRSALLVLLSTAATVPAYAQEPVATETTAEDREDVIVVTANVCTTPDTSCRFSSRRFAVTTMTSSRSSASVSVATGSCA